MKGASRIDGTLPADDQALQDIVRQGALVPLLAALAQATGDLLLLRDDLRPDPAHIREPQGGLSGEQRARARELIAEASATAGGRATANPIAAHRHRRRCARSWSS